MFFSEYFFVFTIFFFVLSFLIGLSFYTKNTIKEVQNRIAFINDQIALSGDEIDTIESFIMVEANNIDRLNSKQHQDGAFYNKMYDKKNYATNLYSDNLN